VTEDLRLPHGSGNVWRDLGYADADIRRAETIIAGRIIATLDDRRLSTRQAAKATGFAAADFEPDAEAAGRGHCRDWVTTMPLSPGPKRRPGGGGFG